MTHSNNLILIIPTNSQLIHHLNLNIIIFIIIIIIIIIITNNYYPSKNIILYANNL